MKILSFLFIICFCSTAFCQEKFATYKDDTHKFKVDYPSSWEQIHLHNTIWAIRSEYTSAKDKYEDGVQIMRHKTPHDTTSSKNFAYKKAAEVTKLGGKVTKTENITFKNLPATRLTYLLTHKGHELKYQQYFVIYNKHVWTFSYAAVYDDFDHWMPYIVKIWDSFAFTA